MNHHSVLVAFINKSQLGVKINRKTLIKLEFNSETGNKKNYSWVNAEHLDFAIEVTKDNYTTNASTTASTIYRNTPGKSYVDQELLLDQF